MGSPDLHGHYHGCGAPGMGCYLHAHTYICVALAVVILQCESAAYTLWVDGNGCAAAHLCCSQGNSSDELPESVPGTVRFTGLDQSGATPLQV